MSHTRPVWRLENGEAVLVAYEVYRRGNQYGRIPGVLGRSEFGLEIVVSIAFQVHVVHTDETGWSINSVWAFLSENARVLLFGVHKDAETLNTILDPETFAGIVISDDAAVYQNFTHAQKCWAHLLRKAIKRTCPFSETGAA